MADAYTRTDLRLAATTTIRRLCVTIAQNLWDRVEHGGLTAGPPDHHFLLRSRWGAPANFSAHGRALRTFDRIATQLQSAEVAAVAKELAASVENRLIAWSDELGDEFPVYVITLKLRRRRGVGKLQPSEIGFTLSSDAFTAFDVVPNRGLLGVRLREGLARRPALRLEVIDTKLPGERQRQHPTSLKIRLPPGYAVAASGCQLSTKDHADRVVERQLALEELADGVVECRPDPGERWFSMRQWRSDVVENSIVSGVSAAAAVFGLTRRSESHELMLCLARRAGERLGGVAAVESRLGWDLASVRKPLPLYSAGP